MKKAEVKHTTIRNGNLFCSHCGNEFVIGFPVPVDDMTKKIDAFNVLHADCKPTWKEPVADQSKSVQEKAMLWFAKGQRGMSSEAMWFKFMNQNTGQISPPWDPDDFSRCYKLLQFVPEWKNEMDKLRSLSPIWNRLVDNWDKLTAMYEQNVREDWKNYKKIGMYDFMCTLTRLNEKR